MKKTLYFKDGTSDKVYMAEVVPADGGFAVNFAYGRRGSTMATGTKTQTPVTEPEAQKIFNRLIAEKTAKGYTEGEEGTPYIGAQGDDRVTGVVPQLLNFIDLERMQDLLYDPHYCAQQKWDGRRIMIRKMSRADGGYSTVAINRKGLEVGCPAPVLSYVARIPGSFILDGEMVGDCYHVFDCFMIDASGRIDAISSGFYFDRLERLDQLVPNSLNFLVVRTAVSTAEKLALLAELEASNAEGIVFKNLYAPYSSGRPASGGNQLKYKFYATLSARVMKHNAKRSVNLALTDGLVWFDCGNVTIPPNKEIPPVDSIVEVRYLYATSGGILYQPTYLDERIDQSYDGCLLTQLKFSGQEDDS